MIKGYKFLVNEEEKSRILNLHQNRTRFQYLNISEQENDTSKISNDKGGPVDSKLISKDFSNNDSLGTSGSSGSSGTSGFSGTSGPSASSETSGSTDSISTGTTKEFVPPKNHQEGIAQIKTKLQELNYNITNIGEAVLKYLSDNKPK